MIVVSPCHPATPAPLTVRRRRRTVTFVLQLVKEGRLEAVELKKNVVRVSEASLRRYVNGLKKVGGG